MASSRPPWPPGVGLNSISDLGGALLAASASDRHAGFLGCGFFLSPLSSWQGEHPHMGPPSHMSELQEHLCDGFMFGIFCDDWSTPMLGGWRLTISTSTRSVSPNVASTHKASGRREASWFLADS